MRPRLTKSAESALTHALEAASKLGHNYIGSEHLLLGLLKQQNSVAAYIFLSFV